MSHEDLALATLYMKSRPVSVEQEISKDVDRLIAALCCDQLTAKELAHANVDTARRFMTTNNPQLREIGRLVIDCGQFYEGKDMTTKDCRHCSRVTELASRTSLSLVLARC
jgi:hypothetical protein